MVGLGPGDRNYSAPAAIAAIEQADVIVGYKTYLDLIADLLEGKEVVNSGMRKEIDRAREAMVHASQGKSVAVVSSGDPGVYGMAGIVLEMLHEQGDNQIQVEVIPGVTAATAAAAALGAPLMHDFAVISLSDLLTPWETIEKRIHAAGDGDFVIVLYNPKSHGRQTHIETTRDMLLTYKQPSTPVGIVRNAKRGEQEAIVTTLAEMLEHPIDMLTTVIIGNSQTKVIDGRIVTPRGYQI